MPDLTFFIILGIAFTVWVVSTIYKNAEEAKKRQEQAGNPRPARPAASEIDKFLEEIQRRRMQQQSSTTRSFPPTPPVQGKPVLPILIEKPKPVIPKALPPRPPVQARAVSTPRPLPARPVTAILANRIMPVPAVLVPESPLVQFLEATNPEPEPVMATRPGTVSRPGSAQLGEIIKVLHSTKGIRQALVASMVLGPPRSKGGGSRGF